MTEPCAHCPWRVGVDAWAIGRDHTPEVPPLHQHEMESLARNQESGGFQAKVMACHLTFKGEDSLPCQNLVCVGFALSEEAKHNLNYRFLVARRKIDPVEFGCTDPLHATFKEMLAANPARPSSVSRQLLERGPE